MCSWTCAVNEAEKGVAAEERRSIGREGTYFEDWKKNGIFVIDGNCLVGQERQMPERKGRQQAEWVGCRTHGARLAGMTGSM